MKKEKMDEKCLRCRYHQPCPEYTLVLNKEARWVAGVHCTHYDMRKEAWVIPSTTGMKCKLYREER